MSGGVDSSVAAALLKDAGHEVIGATMRLFPACDGVAEPREQAIEDARRAAARLSIPHHVAELAGLFQRQVLDYFLDEYRRARTPNPCVRCNQRIKFGALLDQARALGGSFSPRATTSAWPPARAGTRSAGPPAARRTRATCCRG